MENFFRTTLSALHFNHNLMRENKLGEATVREVKENQNYGKFFIVNLEVTGKPYTFQKLKITCYVSCVTLY